jgi:predicted site-specific integrase-resolvase
MKQRYIKLSEYAKINCVTYKTAWKRFNDGLLTKAFKNEFGDILVEVEPEIKYNKVAIYSRVSSNEMKDNLNRQQDRLINYCKLNDLEIISKTKEIGSGMNDNRKKLNKILSDDSWNVLLIENKDRLTRFGFNYLEQLLNKLNKKIIIVNETTDVKSDLMEDLISIIYSFSARMYGLRRKKNKEDIINFIEN